MMMGDLAHNYRRWVTIIVMVGAALLMATPAAASCNPSDSGSTENDSMTCDAAHPSNGGIVAGDLGNDSIIINGSANLTLVSGDLRLAGGFTLMPIGSGGDDTIIINGNVAGFVTGDQVRGNGGNDTIIVNAPVDGEVIGDYVEGGNGGDDRIFISSAVDAVRADEIQSGSVGGDDYVELQDGARVRQPIDGGGGSDTLAFAFDTSAAEDTELAALIAAASPERGSITFRGNTYAWTNFEQIVQITPEVAQPQPNTGSARLNNFGTLGAVYAAQGQGIQVYAIDADSRGRLVAYISARDLAKLPAQPAQNMLLAASEDGKFAIYKLATGEYQVNIGPFGDDGKVEVTTWRGIPATDIKRSEFFTNR